MAPRERDVPSDPVQRPKTASAARRRVLVVDDHVDSARSLSLVLRALGHETRVAHDGLGALAEADEYAPDVILLDLGMPNLDGYDACRRIRERAWGRSVVLIAVTGWGRDEDRRRSRAAGFDHHVVKPVDPAVLSEVLGRGSSSAGA